MVHINDEIFIVYFTSCNILMLLYFYTEILYIINQNIMKNILDLKMKIKDFLSLFWKKTI